MARHHEEPRTALCVRRAFECGRIECGDHPRGGVAELTDGLPAGHLHERVLRLRPSQLLTGPLPGLLGDPSQSVHVSKRDVTGAHCVSDCRHGGQCVRLPHLATRLTEPGPRGACPGRDEVPVTGADCSRGVLLGDHQVRSRLRKHPCHLVESPEGPGPLAPGPRAAPVGGPADGGRLFHERVELYQCRLPGLELSPLRIEHVFEHSPICGRWQGSDLH